jgi:nitrite reductase (NO-forming)
MHASTLSHTRISLILFGILLLLGYAAEPASAQSHRDVTGTGTARTVDIVRDPADLPSSVGSRAATTVRVKLEAIEVIGQLDAAAGTTYRYWTFNGKVPGPMIRVRQGDNVEITLHNDAGSHMVHSVDFHAALGPGGGAALSQAVPGESKTFTFQATIPGLFVYHCGTPMVAEHIANGMYGLILVEPAGGLPHADREYYVMQGELYTDSPFGKAGSQAFSSAKLMREAPEYYVFNGAVDALTKARTLRADVGQAVRIFFGDAGPNKASSLHVVGEIFTRDYVLGSLTSPPLLNVQTAAVPPGAAEIVELKAVMPGQFNLMDHAMSRMSKGLMATLEVSGRADAALMHVGPEPGPGELQPTTIASSRAIGMDETGQGDMRPPSASESPADRDSAGDSAHRAAGTVAMDHEPEMRHAKLAPKPGQLNRLIGCLKPHDLEIMLALLHSNKVYRLQGRPLEFSQNEDRIVRVTGHLGVIVPVDDPSIPTFTVDTVDELASTCDAKISPEKLRQLSTARSEDQSSSAGTAIGMTDMKFTRTTVNIQAGQSVTWKNTSAVVHNVVDDPNKAIAASDVHLPPAVQPFGSGFLQPGETYTHTFIAPGIYRYVCTLHESGGMKGTVVVK